MKIHAFAAQQAGGRLEPFAYEAGPLGGNEVEIAVTHCGICHSDIHLIDNDWHTDRYPLVPGHEVVGTVRALGAAVRGLSAGQRVGIGWQCGSCMQCDSCVRGDHNLCPESLGTCADQHGGFADACRADARFVFPIPDALDSAAVSPLFCGGITVYSPLVHYGVRPAMRVGVMGIGGLGHLALQFSRAFGCEVTAFSSSPEKEAEARKFGAHGFVSLKDKAASQRAARSLDFLFATAPHGMDWDSVMGLLRPDGRLCVVGAVPEPIQLNAFSLIVGRRSLCGSPIGSPAAIREMLEFSARHQIAAQIETLPMDRVNDALERVRANKARYRMVLKA